MNSFILTIVVSIIVVILLSVVIVRRLERRRTQEVLDTFGGKRVFALSSNANFFGQESQGAGQVRGNGVLVLMEEELYFEMWMPKREFRIPLSSMISVESPRSHLGKTRGRELLKVIYQNEAGVKDSMAWLVHNLSDWKSALEKAISLKSKIGFLSLNHQ